MKTAKEILDEKLKDERNFCIGGKYTLMEYVMIEAMEEYASNKVDAVVRQGVSQPVLRTDIEEKYNELIMAVAKKFTNETRHQTALRYINEAESFNDNSCAKNESEQTA